MSRHRLDEFARRLGTPLNRRDCAAIVLGLIAGSSTSNRLRHVDAADTNCIAEPRPVLCGQQECGVALNQCREIVPCGTCPSESMCILGRCTSACFEGDQKGRYLPCVPTPEKCARGLQLLGGVDLRECDLGHADLRGANLRGADLRHANLHEADLSHASLAFAFLTGAFLWHATVTKSQLQMAEAIEVNMMGANLSGAFLTSANLRGACLEDVDLTDADLRFANLESANLKGAQWDNTICPDASNSDEHGGTCCGHVNGAKIRIGCSSVTVDQQSSIQ